MRSKIATKYYKILQILQKNKNLKAIISELFYTPLKRRVGDSDFNRKSRKSYILIDFERF